MKLLLLLCSSLLMNTNAQDCVFQRPLTSEQEGRGDVATVNSNPERPLDLVIRFTLRKFDHFCFLNITNSTDGSMVAFNLTKKVKEDESDFSPTYGDIDGLGRKMRINFKRNKLTIKNSFENTQFSDLSGPYKINEKRFFVLPILKPDFKPTEQKVKGQCEESEDSVTISAMVKTNELFRLCFQYFTEFLKENIQLDCHPGVCTPPSSNGFFNVTIFNKTHTDLSVTCRPPSLNYALSLKIEDNCSTPMGGGVTALLAVLAILFITLLVLVISNIKHIKEKKKIIKNPKPKCPEWCNGLLYNRGLIDIDMKDPLGEGEFGIVYKGILQQIGDAHNCRATSSQFPALGNNYQQLVAVKTYCPASAQGHDDLHQEGELLSTLEYHPNIINLLAVSLDTPVYHNRILLINELCEKGSLLILLQNKRKEIESSEDGINWTEDFNQEVMTLWSFQISRGMEFLSMKNIIHGDLAARNILLDGNGTVKINDFGKAKKVNYDNIAVCVSGVQPLAWMAPEAIQNQEVSLVSDIWAYGITLWEIFSLGMHPYQERPFQDMVNDIHNGYRLPQPELCPSKIYSLMRDCWKKEPGLRPPWRELTAAMESMVESKYLDKYWKIEDAYKMIYCNIRNYSKMDKGKTRDTYDTPLCDDNLV